MFRKFRKKTKDTAPVAPSPAQAEPQELFRSRGDTRAQNGDYNGAVMMYDEALGFAPTDTTLLLSRSFALMMSTPPKLDLALQDADTAIQHNPTHWQAWLQKGEARLKMGDVNGAEEDLMKAVGFAQGGDKLTAQRSLADARSRRGQPAPAAPNPSPPLAPSSAQTTTPTNIISDSPPVIQPSAPTPARTNSVSATPAPITQPSTSTTRPSQPPSVTQTTSTTRMNPVSVPPITQSSGASTNRLSRMASGVASVINAVKPTPSSTVPTTQSSGGTPRNAANQAPQSAPVTRTDEPSVSQTSPSRPFRPDDLRELTSEAPPGYTMNLTNADPTVRALSQEALTAQLTELQTVLAPKNKGSLSIRPYTAAGSIDAMQLVYVGMTLFELTARELGTPTYLHPSFRNMAVDMLSYPGNTMLDMDCESSGYYEGKLPGTVSISGCSEEYREHQLLRSPLLNIALEGTTVLPAMALDKIVDRMRLLQRLSTLEDNQALSDILGLSQLSTLQSGFYATGGRQRQIEAICMALTRSLYDAPTRFIDFSKARNMSNNTLGNSTQGIGLQNFLFQILLGAELLIRLRKEPVSTSYAGLVTNAISALMIVSDLWMQNVTIQGPRAITTTSTSTPNPPTPNMYILVAGKHQQQAEGLIRFGEALSWPYMDEARNYIENAYQDLIANKQTVGFDICDWLYGLVLPGKVFRHRIMCCLVYASPSIRSFNPAPFWDNGLVVQKKSYWPKRSVVGRVLGGLKNPRSVCGWVGPVPAPEGNFSGWIRLNARRVGIPVPVNATQTSLQSLGFGQLDGTESPEVILQSITDPNEWIQASPPSRPSSDTSSSVFTGLHLTETPSNTTSLIGALSAASGSKEYRASLEFEVNGTLTRYTLYSNPIFVSAPPCVGTHTMHRRQAQNYLRSLVKVADLKEAYLPSDTLVIIDALGQGEEAVARAWCAERARNAVIRRDGECCFSCATVVAAGNTGLGFNILIWSR